RFDGPGVGKGGQHAPVQCDLGGGTGGERGDGLLLQPVRELVYGQLGLLPLFLAVLGRELGSLTDLASHDFGGGRHHVPVAGGQLGQGRDGVAGGEHDLLGQVRGLGADGELPCPEDERGDGGEGLLVVDAACVGQVLCDRAGQFAGAYGLLVAVDELV